MGRPERAQAEALFHEGNRLLTTGDFGRAQAEFRHAIELDPDFVEAHANLGLALNLGGMPEEAEASYRRSIELHPGVAQTHLNLGALLASRKRFAEAEAAYAQAIALQPHFPAAWSNLGALYASMKREEDAERCHRTALSQDAGHAKARFNLSYLLLRQARFEEGWQCLEARDWYAPLGAYLACPRWRGEPLAGKSVLIGYEAGHGDMIQFCRYAAALKAQGAAHITMLCHPALKTLFSTFSTADRIVGYDEPFPPSGWDFWTPLLSIPGHCRTNLDSIPASLPYLHAAPERIEKWAPHLPNGSFLVGLVWKGSPQFENDADRSIPSLDLLEPLGSLPHIRFVSLQKGSGEDETANPPQGLSLCHLGSKIEDFADTAAIISQLDLVICVDTAVAHLSGALGKPCWVLLPFYQTDWRWLDARSDSPWYPGVMRLFRQSTMGDWKAVIEEVRAALAQQVEADGMKERLGNSATITPLSG